MANPNIKTQMRFGKHDVEVLTKIKGSRDPFKLAPLNEFCRSIAGKAELIPEFDENIKWNMKKDRLPREELFGSPNKGLPPSMWQVDDLNTGRHPLSRTSSLNNAPKKKPRNNIDSEKEMFVDNN